MAYSVLLATSAYTTTNQHATGRAHRFTIWQVYEAATGLLVVDSGWEPANLTSYITPAVLEEDVEYEVQVAHVDALGGETWSDPVPLAQALEEEMPIALPARPPALQALYFGTAGAILRADTGAADRGVPITALLRPADAAPGGIGGDALYSTLYLTVGHMLATTLVLTPIANGERQAAITLALPSVDAPTVETYEITLGVARVQGGLERSRQGLRATTFTVEVAVPAYAYPHIEIHSIEAGGVVLRERFPAVSFSPELLTPSALDPVQRLYYGLASSMARSDVGQTDAEAPVRAYVETIEAAPAGESGEAIFRQLYLVLTRSNTAPFTLRLYPVLDGVVLPSIPLLFAPTEAPVGEVIEVPLSRPVLVRGVERARNALRGAILSIGIAAEDGLPDGDHIIEHMELDGEVVRESRQPAGGT
jgi:hypothetical protein